VGAQAFKGVATIVYNRAQREELEEKFGLARGAVQQLRAGDAELLADVRLVRPMLSTVARGPSSTSAASFVQLSYH
jgi:hypothetical protein